MYQLRQTDVFAKWLQGLRDRKGKARVLAKLDSVRLGNLGDTKRVGGGIREFRVHAGPGYRIYYVREEKFVLLLLCGGDKSSQTQDIERAKRILKELDEK